MVDVETISVVEVVPGGVTVAGEKLHVAPVGSPEQPNETAELNPFSGVTESLVVPTCPAITVNAAVVGHGLGWQGRDRVALFIFQVWVTLFIELLPTVESSVQSI